MGSRTAAALALVLASACGRAWYDPRDRGGGDAGLSGSGDGGSGGDSDGGGGGDSDAGVLTTGVATADTWLSESDPEQNFGAALVLGTAGSSDATILLRFDLGIVAAGAVPRAVTLAVSTSDGAQEPARVRIYRVFEDWSEDEASWNLRTTGQAWTRAGCGVGSRDAAARAEVSIEAPSTRYQVALPTSVVQGWIDDPASNRGLALIASAGLELLASESDDPAHRPTLAVEWDR